MSLLFTSRKVRKLRKKAKAGDAEAQYELANCYAKGGGVRKNRMAAFFWYVQSAEGGYAKGETALGYIYEWGSWGVRQNYQKAMYWFKKAEAQGIAQARMHVTILTAVMKEDKKEPSE